MADDLDRDPNCLFCKIVSEEIPSDRVYEDEHVIVFRDITPRAPTHVLERQIGQKSNNRFKLKHNIDVGQRMLILHHELIAQSANVED